MIRSKGEAGTGNIVEAVRHLRSILGSLRAIAATTAAGILTMITKSNWWSYTMALGFIASLLVYGGLLLQARTPSQHSDRQPGN